MECCSWRLRHLVVSWRGWCVWCRMHYLRVFFFLSSAFFVDGLWTGRCPYLRCTRRFPYYLFGGDPARQCSLPRNSPRRWRGLRLPSALSHVVSRPLEMTRRGDGWREPSGWGAVSVRGVGWGSSPPSCAFTRSARWRLSKLMGQVAAAVAQRQRPRPHFLTHPVPPLRKAGSFPRSGHPSPRGEHLFVRPHLSPSAAGCGPPWPAMTTERGAPPSRHPAPVRAPGRVSPPLPSPPPLQPPPPPPLPPPPPPPP